MSSFTIVSILMNYPWLKSPQNKDHENLVNSNQRNFGIKRIIMFSYDLHHSSCLPIILPSIVRQHITKELFSRVYKNIQMSCRVCRIPVTSAKSTWLGHMMCTGEYAEMWNGFEKGSSKEFQIEVA